MAQLARSLLCKHEGPSSILSNWLKPSVLDLAYNPHPRLVETGASLGLTGVVSARPVREPVSKQRMDRTQRMTTRSDL